MLIVTIWCGISESLLMNGVSIMDSLFKTFSTSPSGRNHARARSALLSFEYLLERTLFPDWVNSEGIHLQFFHPGCVSQQKNTIRWIIWFVWRWSMSSLGHQCAFSLLRIGSIERWGEFLSGAVQWLLPFYRQVVLPAAFWFKNLCKRDSQLNVYAQLRISLAWIFKSKSGW